MLLIFCLALIVVASGMTLTRGEDTAPSYDVAPALDSNAGKNVRRLRGSHKPHTKGDEERMIPVFTFWSDEMLGRTEFASTTSTTSTTSTQSSQNAL
ncbi:hypothetical protein PHYSODRAFT_287100 [Phytophthora sojae]|uniref:RxLR effector protein n=2 Tax=Phytophthora sojae TaxID=67593 RepID=G5A139_PHYSP|nr:hypothetical protein PHYSODRAFT_287100 [Phytophthora sojae]AEK81362.1 Avh453 [Phytophthora sojae]AEK81363.1 Avh453 [Phytophthora sojae]AEK81364.1 Avh453 [Phytophthora sojae]EGZ10641.1 hypothetical protein PHYSODRAFT_287100 [Phytophthora sojae]|eukprot:XP_009533386.1 hypothetical protein PHYSODRAFT_287100 [Phytophthora sojae]